MALEPMFKTLMRNMAPRQSTAAILLKFFKDRKDLFNHVK